MLNTVYFNETDIPVLFMKRFLFSCLGLLPRMMLLWRNAFPRSAKELESEKARGDAFTWKISLEARGGALSSMHSFLQVSSNLRQHFLNRHQKNLFISKTKRNFKF